MNELRALSAEDYAQLDRIGRWVYETCLIFGATASTAWKVAGTFVQGVEGVWQGRYPPPRSAHDVHAKADRMERAARGAATRRRNREAREQHAPE